MHTTHTSIRKLALWVILLIGTLLAVEGLMATYFLFFARTYYRPLYLERINNQHLWRTEYHDWGGWHKPSSTANHIDNCFSAVYRSNSYGARDRKRSLAAGSKRVIMLGDSFVEGFAVNEEVRLSNLLERGLGIEILNFGMTHFGPLQYQILYEKLAKRFDHDAVLIGFLPENDFIDNDPHFHRVTPDFTSRYIPYYGEKGEVFYPRPRPSPGDPSPFAKQYDRDNPETRTFIQNVSRLFWIYGLYRDVRYNMTVLQYPRPTSYVGYFETDETRIARVSNTLIAIKDAASPWLVLVVPSQTTSPGPMLARTRFGAAFHGCRMRTVLERMGSLRSTCSNCGLNAVSMERQCTCRAMAIGTKPVIAPLSRRSSHLSETLSNTRPAFHGPRRATSEKI